MAGVDAAFTRVLGVGLLGLVAATAALGAGGAPARSLLFAAVAAPVWLWVMGTLAWLRTHERASGPLGLATGLTLLRGWLMSALAGFVVPPPRGHIIIWAPAVIYTTAALCDLLDGYVARRRGEVGAVGAQLDGGVDALGLLVAPVVAIALGRLPPWYLVLGAGYYVFHLGLWLRARRGRPVHMDCLQPSRRTRMFAGFQMGLVATALFPVLGPPATSVAATLFMLPSVLLFVRDWLVVTGRLDPAGSGYLRLVARTQALLLVALPVPLRVVSAAGLAALVGAGGQLAPALLAPALCILIGLVTRLAAFAAAIPLALLLSAAPSLPAWTTFVALVALLLLGAGRAALWTPEDRLLLRRAGEAPVSRTALRARPDGGFHVETGE